MAATSRARKLPTKKRALSTKKSMAGSRAAHTTAFSIEHAESVSEGMNAHSMPSTTLQLCAKASSSRARKLPTKRTREGAGPKSPAACATKVTESSLGGSNNDSLIPSKQSTIIFIAGVGTAISVVSQRPAKTARKIKGLVFSDPHDNTEHVAKKRKKVKTAKSDDIALGGVESLPCSNAEQSKRNSNETNLEDLQIKEAVNDVAGVIADEIRHCHFLFGLANRPKIIIYGEMEGGFNKNTCVAPNGGSGSASQGSSYPNPCDINSIVEVVMRFAVEVYCPFLLSARQSVKNSSPPNVDRVRMSTLLAIREMLIMNGATLFTCSTLKSLSERLYLSHVFANAIVRNTAKRLHAHAAEGTFFADFIQATHNYDSKTEDFQFALTRADARSIYVHQGGKQVAPEETIVAKMGFNYARERHPLLRNDRLHVKKSGDASIVNDRPLTCAAPTACAAFHIESATRTTAEQGADDKETLESFKRFIKKKLIRGKSKKRSDDVITQHGT